VKRPRTLGELRASGWRSRSVKDELRENLLGKLASGAALFPGIVGYERTVLPQVQNAILSRHDFILLGLRGQAKTRILRALHALLDEQLPVIAGSELNEDPYAPLTPASRARAAELGDALPIEWLPRESRYREKLATPDVTIADLIGDIDPVKAATRKLAFADPEVIHYGIVPRTNRGIFAINELPDLPARIQVGLLNVLEERDVQIRGFPLRLELDLLLVFSANPQDYTNRGSIITPLRDRISSQILTHYPQTLEQGIEIARQEAWTERASGVQVEIPRWMRELVEEIAVQARASEMVDQASGVSARVTISLLENVVSNAERRAVLAREERAVARVSDAFAAHSAITGKIELVYEGEREGSQVVAGHLLGKAVKALFDRMLPDAYKPGGTPGSGELDYQPILGFFQGGRSIELSDDLSDEALYARLEIVPGLLAAARRYVGGEGAGELAAGMELVLEGLHQSSLLSKKAQPGSQAYGDMFEDMVRTLKK